MGHVGAEFTEFGEASGLLELAPLLLELLAGGEQSALAAVEQPLQQQVVAAEQQHQRQGAPAPLLMLAQPVPGRLPPGALQGVAIQRLEQAVDAKLAGGHCPARRIGGHGRLAVCWQVEQGSRHRQGKRRGGLLRLGEGPVRVEPGRALAAKARRRLVVQHPKIRVGDLALPHHALQLAHGHYGGGHLVRRQLLDEPVQGEAGEAHGGEEALQPDPLLVRLEAVGEVATEGVFRHGGDRPPLEILPVPVGGMGAHHQGGAYGEVVTPRRALEGGEPGQRILARQTHRLARVGDDKVEPVLCDGLGQGIELQGHQREAPLWHALIQPAHQRLPLGLRKRRAAGRQHPYSHRLGQGLLRLGRWGHRPGQGRDDPDPEQQGQQGLAGER
ncbi:hypothetical protein D3C73_729090 [compost metagenome]